MVRDANAGNRRAARSLATRLWSRGEGSKLCKHELGSSRDWKKSWAWCCRRCWREDRSATYKELAYDMPRVHSNMIFIARFWIASMCKESLLVILWCQIQEQYSMTDIWHLITINTYLLIHHCNLEASYDVKIPTYIHKHIKSVNK